jgi:hypothetical protein
MDALITAAARAVPPRKRRHGNFRTQPAIAATTAAGCSGKSAWRGPHG